MPTSRLLLALIAFVGACSFQPGRLSTSATDDATRPDATGDSDGDFVLDDVDNCVSVKNANQRDFDLDKRGDACDGCPHRMSDDDPDFDLDGVGDACDPRPMLAGDARAIWIGFYDGIDINGWTNNGGAWAVQNHKLVQSTLGFSLLDSPLQYFDVYFEARLEVTSALNESGFCGSDVPIGTQYYCCGVLLNGQPEARAVSAWPGQMQIGDPKPFPVGLGDVVDIVGTMTSTQNVCRFTNKGSVVTSATGRGPRALGTAVFYATVPATYHYAFVVTIGGS